MKKEEETKYYISKEVCHDDFLFIVTILAVIFRDMKYQVQYGDYEEWQWTVPALLLPSRVRLIVSDFSIRKVKLHHPDGMVIEFVLK